MLGDHDPRGDPGETMPIDVTRYVSYVEPYPTVHVVEDPDADKPPTWAVLAACFGGLLLVGSVLLLAVFIP